MTGQLPLFPSPDELWAAEERRRVVAQRMAELELNAMYRDQPEADDDDEHDDEHDDEQFRDAVEEQP